MPLRELSFLAAPAIVAGVVVVMVLRSKPKKVDMNVTEEKLRQRIPAEVLAKLEFSDPYTCLTCEGITPDEMRHLIDIPTLEACGFDYCPDLTDESLLVLAQVPRLTDISFWECNGLTDAGLAYLARLTVLRSLYFDSCQRITDTGLKHLAKLRNLRTLGLIGCPAITDAAVAELQRSLPGCVIQREWPRPPDAELFD